MVLNLSYGAGGGFPRVRPGQLFNLDLTSAEGTSYRLAQLDKKYPLIITAGNGKSIVLYQFYPVAGGVYR